MAAGFLWVTLLVGSDRHLGTGNGRLRAKSKEKGEAMIAIDVGFIVCSACLVLFLSPVAGAEDRKGAKHR